MKVEGTAGTRSAGSGMITPFATGPDSVMYSRPVAGRYTEAVLDGRVFSVANQAAVNTTDALATTWEGLAVVNPTGSAKNLVFLEFGVAWAVASDTAGAVGLMTADTTGLEATITPRPALSGGSPSIAIADNGGTVGTPVLERVMGHYGTGATSLFTSRPPAVYNIEGSIILPPGRALLTYTTLGATAAAVFFFMWEERAR